MPRIVVGVDAGGTSTVAAVSQDGELVRTHSGPPANPSVRGVEAASAEIAETIADALDGALPHAIFVGAAGAARSEVSNQIEETLHSRFGGARVAVRDDAFIALRAGIPQGDGAVLLAGTGSIAYAICGDSEFRCGGYGFLLGDDGSGFAIGGAALKHLLRAADGRVLYDALCERVSQQADVREAADLLGKIYSSRHAVAFIASFAPMVLELAGEGERSSNKIVQSAALELSDLAKNVVKRSNLAESGASLVLSGSLLGQNSLLTFLLETRLKNDLPSMAIFKCDVEPYAGALAAAELL